MFGYHFELAIQSLRRNVVLTVLMVVAVGVGVGASMTMLTTLVVMSGDPIADKSSQLFVPQIDVFGPESRRFNNAVNLPDQLSYRDAEALQRAHRGVRQASMYAVALSVSPPGADPFHALGMATSGDFFSMFEVPFRSGTAWGSKEDADRENVVVLSSKLADRVFPHSEAVGKIINLGSRDYRVVGVIKHWTPVPHFYDLDSGSYAESEDFFLPFSTAIDRQIRRYGADECSEVPPAGWQGHLNSNCIWIQFWVELPTPAQVRDFRAFLVAYAATQRHQGRFGWTPEIDLHDVTAWMAYQHIVPQEVRVNVLIALAFFVVCLVNAVGLLLAKFSSRAPEHGIRRAMGASRRDLFLQCVTETLLIGSLGGLLGLALTAVGLSGLRKLLEVGAEGANVRLVSLNSQMVLITLAVAVSATVCSGLYPTFRASRVQPAWQIKRS